MAGISRRAMSSITDYETAVPDIVDNVYDAETNPSGIISLALSENHLIHGPLTEYINKNFSITEELATTYAGTTFGGPRLREAMAAHINRYFSPEPPITSNEVLIANGVSAICGMLGFVLGDPGDGVLLMRPIYGKFENDWGITAKMQTLYVNMGSKDPFSEASVQCYEQRLREAEAAGVKVRALQISNPHNPSGICYPRATLVALMRFCAANAIHLISDEIYALSIFTTPDPEPATPFTSLLSIPASEIRSSSPTPTATAASPPTAAIDPDLDPARLFHTEYGLAKDFGAAGLHLGALVTSNRDVAAAFGAIGLLHAPSGASCAIAARMLADTRFVDSLLALSRRRLAENYVAVTRALAAAGIGYWRGGNAGYFLWVDLSAYLMPVSSGEDGDGDGDGSVGASEDVGREEREEELARRILAGGVWLNPGQERGEEPGWFRLIFSHDVEKVLEGVARIVKTLQGDKTRNLPIRLQKEV